MITIKDITIRTALEPGDIGTIIQMHGSMYRDEYHYGVQFEVYVAEGLCEFYRNYDETKDRVWLAEHKGHIVGFLLLMHRDEAAQLRYFLIDPEYRGIGLGKKLMELFVEFLGARDCYLWTTSELKEAAGLYRRFGFVLTEEKASAAFGKEVMEQKYVRAG
jgi:ribosomal protein S18 acetylase RimI-like enzyme